MFETLPRVRRDSLGPTARFTRSGRRRALSRAGVRTAALFQLLNAVNISGEQIWRREKTWKFCLWTPQSQLLLFSQQDLAKPRGGGGGVVLSSLISRARLYLHSDDVIDV